MKGLFLFSLLMFLVFWIGIPFILFRSLNDSFGVGIAILGVLFYLWMLEGGK